MESRAGRWQLCLLQLRALVTFGLGLCVGLQSHHLEYYFSVTSGADVGQTAQVLIDDGYSGGLLLSMAIFGVPVGLFGWSGMGDFSEQWISLLIAISVIIVAVVTRRKAPVARNQDAAP